MNTLHKYTAFYKPKQIDILSKFCDILQYIQNHNLNNFSLYKLQGANSELLVQTLIP